MKIATVAKYLGLSALVLAVGVGCATAPEETAPAEPATEVSDLKAAAAQAIADARAAVNKARSVDGLWPSTEDVLNQASAAYDAGDYEKAIQLAKRAQNEAEQGYNQALLERAKALLQEAKQYEGSMNADQLATLREAEAAIARFEGERAYALLSGLLAELRASLMNYTVERGDSLWGISGKDEVYGNPYQWPLIYKKNQDQIKDADLIYPGQEFAIDKFPTQDEVDAAVNHAKTRGAWSIGVVEESDRAYLNR
ncbi:MAG: hypothetical protein Kow006_15760 [Gammaproteobacteria bacterium]